MKRNAEYAKAARAFIIGKRCAVFPLYAAGEVHHIRGRGWGGRGPLLMDKRFWLPVSQQGHKWIDSHRAEARAKGWLCKVGEWNTTPEQIAARKPREFV